MWHVYNIGTDIVECCGDVVIVGLKTGRNCVVVVVIICININIIVFRHSILFIC